ncbi:nicolin-1 [Nelusetta ayraudi]|uniref:nicolin-1 n=1 Tax=Nelusetta ayraudi TaxID=303726 RepID=UPI003F72C43A
MMSGRGHARAAPVSCSVKPAVYLHIGGATEEQEQSGVCVLDISLPFGQTLNVEQITFQNRYTAELSVRLLRRSQDGAPRWCTALSHLALMDDPHTEGGAQDHCCIHRTQMQVAPDHVTCVRLILRQPSSAWSSFSLENIQIHQQREQGPEKEVSDWLSDLTLADPDPDLQAAPLLVSSSLQQMFALTEVMQTNQTSASIGRFQVDGSYDVNLLSLT